MELLSIPYSLLAHSLLLPERIEAAEPRQLAAAKTWETARKTGHSRRQFRQVECAGRRRKFFRQLRQTTRHLRQTARQFAHLLLQRLDLFRRRLRHSTHCAASAETEHLRHLAHGTALHAAHR